MKNRLRMTRPHGNKCQLSIVNCQFKLGLAGGLLCLWLLLGTQREFLVEVGTMTPFYLSSVWMKEMMAVGGWVAPFRMAACALCACMTRPWLGALLFTTLLVLLAGVWRKALRLPPFLTFLYALPSCWLLVRFCRQGYDLYLDKAPGHVLSPLFMLLVLGALVWLVRRLIKREPHRPPCSSSLVSHLACLLLFLLACLFSFRDANFHSILAMKHAADRGQWEEVLTEASRMHRDALSPTRTQVMLTRLALYKMGRSGEDTFRYPDGDAPYAARTDNQYLRLMAGRTIYYHLGKVNYAYRWCMEDMVEYGERPDYLCYMCRAALLNGENALARKYAARLRTNPFYRREAEALTAKAGDSRLIDADPTMRSIMPLMAYNDVLDGDGGRVEAYLLQSFASQQGGTREMTRLSLDATLVLKDIPSFWRHFVRMLPVWMNEEEGHIPRQYQEAAILFARLQGGIDLTGVPLDSQLIQRFDALVEASAKGSAKGDDYNARALRPQFGDTYWYYYFFVTDLKTN